MQHTLIGLALVVIVAIVAALAAPTFVDWNGWRAEFEARASALVGARVAIRGPISAMLLPTPAFVFNDVTVGGREQSGLTAAEVRGVLSLGALVRGALEAEEVVLSRPVARLVIERDGRLVLPAGVGGGFDAISISRVTIERGALAIENRAGGFVAIDELNATGELRSRVGPLRLDGRFVHEGRRFALRLAAGRFAADGSGRVRLSLDRADGAQFEADGAFLLAGAAPRFEGKATLAARGDAPWRVAATARANADEVVLSELTLALGADERAIELAGDARFEPRPNGRITVALRAARLDLDQAARGNAPRKPWTALAPLFEALALGEGLPFRGRAEVVIDSIAAGGGLVRDLRAVLALRDGALVAESVEARLPGRGFMRARGTAGGAAFAGDIALEAEEPAAFMRWLAGTGRALAVEEGGALKLSGKLEASANGIAIEQLSGALGITRIVGRARYTAAAKPERFAFELEVVRPEGLESVVEMAAGTDEAGALVRRVAAFGPSVQFSGTVIAEPRGYAAEITARGSALQASLRMRLDAAGMLAEDARFTVESEAGRLLTLVGLAPGRVSGQGRLEGALARQKDGALSVDGRLVVPGATIAGAGNLRVAADGRIEPALKLTLDGADLRPLAPALDRGAGERALPGGGTARLTRQRDGIVLDDLALKLGEARISGRLEFAALDPPQFAGRLVVDRTELATLLALALGRGGGTGLWPDTPLSPAPLSGASGAVDLEIAALPLAGALVAANAEFRLRVGAAETAITGFAADLVGGRLTGEVRIRNPLALDARLSLAKADLARLVPGNKLRGRADITLILSGQGKTPAALAASLAGQGVLLADAPEIDGLDPGALTAVLDNPPPPDEAKVTAVLAEALARGPLKLDRLEASLVVAAGVARAGKVRTAAGPVQVALEGSVDLARLILDAAVELEAPAPPGLSARPTAVVRWRGPLAAPERRIEAGGLATVLALHAMERVTNQIQSGVPIIMAPAEPIAQERVPAPPKRPAPQPKAAPPLPPPLEIRPVPGARPKQPREERVLQ
ncbi:MAG TPA: AsmA family protein [Xanthobacteraceae bacterium]|nr:AsmA family protein [Xanthobacteraceae bacterium]